MARCLKGYVREGLLISEGLAFNIENDSSVDSDFVRSILREAFSFNRPSRWVCRPVFYLGDNGCLREIEYYLNSSNNMGVLLRKRVMKNGKNNFELNVSFQERNQFVRGESKNYAEFLERLFEHVHKYADRAF